MNWHPIFPNLGDTEPQVWLSDQRPGVRISQARTVGAPFYVTAADVMGADWWTRAATLADAQRVADQIA